MNANVTSPWPLDPESARLEAELAAHLRTMAVLRPYMEGTTRTVAEALELMRADGLVVRLMLVAPEARV